MGNLPEELRERLAADFKKSYQEAARLSETDMAALMEKVQKISEEGVDVKKLKKTKTKKEKKAEQ